MQHDFLFICLWEMKGHIEQIYATGASFGAGRSVAYCLLTNYKVLVSLQDCNSLDFLLEVLF